VGGFNDALNLDQFPEVWKASHEAANESTDVEQDAAVAKEPCGRRLSERLNFRMAAGQDFTFLLGSSISDTLAIRSDRILIAIASLNGYK